LPDSILEVIDYSKDNAAADMFGKLPKSDVLKFILNDGSWIAVRPSGTEPKIKVYYSIRGENKSALEEKFKTIQGKVNQFIEK
ncbi:MAG: phospho-sugar mutase, partial [Clostridia bacterium]|nr:phospho-sugar mutase [Clostridia bacterium]